MIKHIQCWHRRRKYRVGREISRMIACDVRRDLIVVSCERIEQGLITVRMKNNNLLGLSKGLIPPSEYGEQLELKIDELWKWSGHSWGGRPDGRSIADSEGANMNQTNPQQDNSEGTPLMRAPDL